MRKEEIELGVETTKAKPDASAILKDPNGIKLEGDSRRSFELYRLSPTTIFIYGFSPPLFGAIAAIGIALIFHNSQISNYNWQCGRARFPSLSRIINLPLERIFWQLFILFHVPIRIIELMTGFSRYGRLMNIHCRHKWFYQLARYCYFYVGMAELIFLAALSIVGERENGYYHVVFFYTFGFCGIGFFIANTICHRQSLYYLNPYGRLSYYLKILFSSAYMLSIPVLIGSFFMYWKACILVAYDVFALCEYVEVFLNIAYHGCAYLDIRYKVIFSVRLMCPEEKRELERKSIFNFRNYSKIFSRSSEPAKKLPLPITETT